MYVSVKVNEPCVADEFPMTWEEIKNREGVYQQKGAPKDSYVITVHGDRRTVFFVDRGGCMLVAEHDGWFKSKFKKASVSLCLEIKGHD